jgi:hypothetical protein
MIVSRIQTGLLVANTNPTIAITMQNFVPVKPCGGAASFEILF